MRKTSSIIYFLLMNLLVAGQSANDWIDFNKQYVKLNIAEDGFYRVTGLELAQTGFDISNVSASNFRLFRKGKEVAIKRKIASDGATLDYFDFWGERNDGKSDSKLYLSNTQPHHYYNLFTDTATYFLTWSDTNIGNSIVKNSNSDITGISQDQYHLKTLRNIYSSNYSSGRFFGTDNSFNLSEYDAGESWTGNFLSKNQYGDFSFVLDEIVSSGIEPLLELILIGGNNLNHVIEISTSTNGTTFNPIDTALFSGYTSLQVITNLPFNQIALDGSITIRTKVLGESEAADRMSVAAISITFPQKISLEADTNTIFQITPKSVDRSYFQLSTSEITGFDFYDVTDPINPIELTKNNQRIIISNSQITRKIAAVRNYKAVPGIYPHTFDKIDISGKSFLIITHEALHETADGIDPIQEYKSYRESIAGGGFKVVSTDIDEIYDQFNYGDPSPIAVKNLLKQGKNSLEYVFIIGKGWTVNFNFYRNNNQNPISGNKSVMIPTYGLPGGDMLFSTGLDPSDTLIPAIPIGRLNARTGADIVIYLDKVRTMESLGYNELWRKNIIQLSGGQTEYELNTFANVIANYKTIAEGDYYGAFAKNQGKTTSSTSQYINISQEVNDGISLLTLFGHSSNTVTDIEIGIASDKGYGYNNKGKYPIVLVNGCKAGEIFANAFSFGEDWMLTKDKGSIAFMAHANFALAVNLNRYSTLFYESAFANGEYFGQSLGNILGRVNKQYFDKYGVDDVSKTQVYQMIFQGDPAVKIFAAKKPDFEIVLSDITSNSFSGERILARQDSFMLNIPVKNFGKTVKDSLLVSLKRTFSNGDTLLYLQTFKGVKRYDTLQFIVFNRSQNPTGTNIFEVDLDPFDSIPELNEFNNGAEYSLFIAEGSTFHLYPIDQSFTSEDTVSLILQPTNLMESERDYIIQVDTSKKFDSPYLKNLSIKGEDLIIDELIFSELKDTTVIYWRSKFLNPSGSEDTIWANSTFTHINVNAVQMGWGNFNSSQILTGELSGLVFDENSGTFLFKESSNPIEILTMGSEIFNYDDLIVSINGVNMLKTINLVDRFCKVNSINAIAFDKSTASPKRPIPPSGPDVNNPLVCGRLPQYVYNMDENDILGSNRYLDLLINNLENGDHLVLFNIDSVSFTKWDATILSSLKLIGVDVSVLATLIDGQPLIILGRKGDIPGQATVILRDNSALPPKQKTINLTNEIIGKFTSGTITSKKIGPSRQWLGVNYNLLTDINDQIKFEIIGIDKNGDQTLFTQSEFDGLNATIYPYIKLKLSVEDVFNQTPPGIDYWAVTYVSPPELILKIDGKEKLELQEGQLFEKKIELINLSGQDFTDSITMIRQIVNSSINSIDIHEEKIPGILSYDTTIVSLNYNTLGKTGVSSLAVRVKSNETELYESNNSLRFDDFINVSRDNINPVLDVTFDGHYILDGDIVSSQPRILIKIKDQNPYLQKSDTTGIDVMVKFPGDEVDFKRISFSGSDLSWSAATEDTDFEVEYSPARLEDGTHTLKVQATDETGNQSGINPYEVNFEIINESSITHFYPYPNPFSTNCRFVFTLTGSSIPDLIKIQIMTISGRVVKEITQAEIGSIRIGNNITEYSWDGRDNYGDRLANGVYLYRVFTHYAGDEIKRRNTSADKSFTKGYGKLYILR